MTTDEKLATIAAAILELAKKSAREWDFDGEQSVATGIDLDLEAQLKEIVGEGADLELPVETEGDGDQRETH